MEAPPPWLSPDLSVWAAMVAPCAMVCRSFIAFAQARGISPTTLAIAWVRHARPITAPIIGVSSLPQLEEALESFDYDLSDEDYKQVTYLFDTEPKEEGLQRFPGLRYNFSRLRRNLNLLK